MLASTGLSVRVFMKPGDAYGLEVGFSRLR